MKLNWGVRGVQNKKPFLPGGGGGYGYFLELCINSDACRTMATQLQ